MGFDYEVCYKKWVTNKAADALSRKPALLQAITSLQTDLVDKIRQSWYHDAALLSLIQQLQQAVRPQSKFTWSSDQLRRNGKLVVGQDLQLRKELLDLFHASAVGGHSGVHPTMARICGAVYWKGLKRDVR